MFVLPLVNTVHYKVKKGVPKPYTRPSSIKIDIYKLYYFKFDILAP